MDYVRVASRAAPIYSIGFLTADGLNVIVDAVTTELKLTENDNELSQKVTMSLVNCMNGSYLLFFQQKRLGITQLPNLKRPQMLL